MSAIYDHVRCIQVPRACTILIQILILYITSMYHKRANPCLLHAQSQAVAVPDSNANFFRIPTGHCSMLRFYLKTASAQNARATQKSADLTMKFHSASVRTELVQSHAQLDLFDCEQVQGLTVRRPA